MDEKEKIINEAVDVYFDMLVRIAYQYTRNLSDAEDIAQDTFLKLLEEKKVMNDVYLKAWLIRVTINSCKDLKKSAWHRRTQPMDLSVLQISAPEEQAVMEEIWDLPENYRNVIYLYYYEGYTVPEIASIIGKSVNTVSSWLTRGRKKLKLIIEEENEYETQRIQNNA